MNNVSFDESRKCKLTDEQKTFDKKMRDTLLPNIFTFFQPKKVNFSFLSEQIRCHHNFCTACFNDLRKLNLLYLSFPLT
jgi:hypothetical protein